MVGGLIVSQALTLFTTPVIYLYLDQLSDWISGRHSATPKENWMEAPKDASVPIRLGERSR